MPQIDESNSKKRSIDDVTDKVVTSDDTSGAEKPDGASNSKRGDGVKKASSSQEAMDSTRTQEGREKKIAKMDASCRKADIEQGENKKLSSSPPPPPSSGATDKADETSKTLDSDAVHNNPNANDKKPQEDGEKNGDSRNANKNAATTSEASGKEGEEVDSKKKEEGVKVEKSALPMITNSRTPIQEVNKKVPILSQPPTATADNDGPMEGMSQSERKRYREKKRRSEITNAIDNLTKILLKVEPANLFQQNNLVYSTNSNNDFSSSRSVRTNNNSSGQQPLNRTEIINHAAQVLDRLFRENEERKMHLMRIHAVGGAKDVNSASNGTNGGPNSTGNHQMMMFPQPVSCLLFIYQPFIQQKTVFSNLLFSSFSYFSLCRSFTILSLLQEHQCPNQK